MKKNSKTTLNRSTKVINREFRIKVFGFDAELGRKINTLVGVSGLVKLIGIDFANKFIERAFVQSYYSDKVTCKLRRGLAISFYVK